MLDTRSANRNRPLGATPAIARILLLALLFTTFLTPSFGDDGEPDSSEWVTAEAFLWILTEEPAETAKTRQRIQQTWQPGYAVMAVELLNFARNPELRRFLVATLEEQTGQALGEDLQAWYEWIWSQPAQDHPQYGQFKKLLYRDIDPKFAEYFDDDRSSDIRLDEIRWGGVVQDGIPPLRSPKMLRAEEADYLQDDNVVFGLEVNGDARAYPKRILAWHEMFTDQVGDVQVAGVYCTLCGTVILYETFSGGVQYQLGTSGFLYRSNKLMYDQATQSLWNTLWGKPAVGPLTGKNIQLARRAVVTTTWGEWRRRHPQTQVLSLDTGHRRDYSEGRAYRNYFATDELMFNVPKLDRRLKNKDEVLTLIDPQGAAKPLAISAKFLAKKQVYHDRLGDLDFVVLTDDSGANRVYRADGIKFKKWDRDDQVKDSNGGVWRLNEDRLVAADGRKLERVAAQRAFWFGWFAAFPETRLVK